MFNCCVDPSTSIHSTETCNTESDEIKWLKKQLEESNKKLAVANKLLLKSNRSKHELQKRIKKLRKKSNLQDQKLISSIKQIFNDDQIEVLMYRSSRGRIWSNDTIKKALKLKFACGSSGYQELLKEKLPLPCERTLRRKLENIKFEEGICEDIFKLLKDKVAEFKDVRERDCMLALDEMAIAPGQQFDSSTLSYCGTASFCTRNGIPSE